SSAARAHGLRRLATTATAQALPTMAVLTSHRSGAMATRRPTTTTADILSRALIVRRSARTVRRPLTRTRHRELIQRPAAAIHLRHIPTLHLAAAIAAAAAVAIVVAAAVAVGEVVVVAATVAAGEAEARTVAEVLSLTVAGTK